MRAVQMEHDAEPRLLAIVRREGIEPSELDDVRLIELDSLLISELLAAVEDTAGHPVAPEAFEPQATTLGDLLRFCAQYEEHEIRTGALDDRVAG